MPESVSDLIVRKCAEHGTLLDADEAALRKLRPRTRQVSHGEDIVREGDKPDVAVLVMSGMLTRYQTAGSGNRQYLSFHIRGDFPDMQSLFLAVMDHSLGALGPCEIATIPHREIVQVIAQRPAVAFALWRLTLIDAAIFRQAITRNGARDHRARLAHLLSEQFHRARCAGATEGESCAFPVSQTQIGQALGMSLPSVTRALQYIREENLADVRAGRIEVFDWPALSRLAGFDATYLHLTKQSEISLTEFKVR